ncbi:unnamed protein product, partial [Ectocarpus fasciculatus]
GEGHSLVLTEGGQVYAFGKGNEGQLGLNRKAMVTREPERIQSLEQETIVKIAAGARSSFAVTASGGVYTWGLIHIDELRNDVNTGDLAGFRQDRADNVVNVTRIISSNIFDQRLISYTGAEEKMQHRANEYSGMLLMQTRRHPQLAPLLITSMLKIRIVSVSAGYAHSMLLSDQGRLYSSGYNDRGQLGLGHRVSTSLFKAVDYLEGKMVLKVACGHQHTLCIAIDRALASQYSITSISTRMNLTQVGGMIYSWGNGVLGQLGLGLRGTSKGRVLPTLLDTLCDEYPNAISDIGAGANFSAAVTQCGKVYSWGHGEYNQHGSGASAFDYVDHFYYFYPRLLVWPANEENDSVVSIASIECGDNFSVAISESGEVFSWGWHDYGVLGHGRGYSLSTPSPIAALNPSRTGGKVQTISCGTNHVFATVACGSEFSKAFAGLINDKISADAAIVVETWDSVVGTREDLIFCHRAVLASRCKYFRGYLSAHEAAKAADSALHDDSDIICDSESNVPKKFVKIYLDIPKLSSIEVYGLLDYLYTDKFSVTSHKRSALGILAKFLGLLDLADACKSFGITHVMSSTFEMDVRMMVLDPAFADIAFTSDGAFLSDSTPEKLSPLPGPDVATEDYGQHSIVGFSHSYVLKRIPFFDHLLSGNYHESTYEFNNAQFRAVNLDTVLLGGIRKEIFFKILTYTYSGFLNSLDIEDISDIMEILITGSHLGIGRLTAFCEKEISVHLADFPENAQNCLEFANEWNFPRL